MGQYVQVKWNAGLRRLRVILSEQVRMEKWVNDEAVWQSTDLQLCRVVVGSSLFRAYNVR